VERGRWEGRKFQLGSSAPGRTRRRRRKRRRRTRRRTRCRRRRRRRRRRRKGEEEVEVEEEAEGEKKKKKKKKIAANFKAQRQVDLVMYKECQIPEQLRRYLMGNLYPKITRMTQT